MTRQSSRGIGPHTLNASTHQGVRQCRGRCSWACTSLTSHHTLLFSYRTCDPAPLPEAIHNSEQDKHGALCFHLYTQWGQAPLAQPHTPLAQAAETCGCDSEAARLCHSLCAATARRRRSSVHQRQAKKGSQCLRMCCEDPTWPSVLLLTATHPWKRESRGNRTSNEDIEQRG